MKLRIRRLDHAEGLPLPERASPGSAGLDLRAAVDEPLTLRPGARCLVPTGLCMAIDDGWEGQVRPRSGLAWKQGVTVLNAPGTIDSDYRGEVRVLLINTGPKAVVIARGDRIAQLLLAQVPEVEVIEVESLDEGGERGAGGFGSTGR
ncbi:MAG: dUTP diphosphatase [Acidobacteriota bacterium]